MMSSEGEAKLGIGERLRAFMRSHTPSISRGVDNYLSMNLAELVERYNLALRNELRDIDTAIGEHDGHIGRLEEWKVNVNNRVIDMNHRVELLEKKYGIRKG